MTYGSVHSVALQSDGKVLLAGAFTNVNGTARNRIARLNANGSVDASYDPGTGADALVRSIAVQPDGRVLIAGDFLSVGGVVGHCVARLYGDSTRTSPSLNVARSNAFVIVSWPANATGYSLQESTNISPTAFWSQVPQSVNTGGLNSVAVPATGLRKFFRLALP